MVEEKKSQNQVVRLDQTIAEAKNLKDLFTSPDIVQYAIAGYKATTGRDDGAERYNQERIAYLEIIHQKPELRTAPNFCHFKVMNKVMHSGLSLRDNKLYLQAVKKGDEVVDIKVDSSPAGKRELMERMPNVKKFPEAQLVMKGDVFVVDKLNNKILRHEGTDKSETKITLENILYSYQRIIYKDGTSDDVIVPQDDLFKAKSKSKIKGDAGVWGDFPGEAAKKTATNRAYNRFHKFTDRTFKLDAEDGTTDTSHEDVSGELSEPETDKTVFTSPSGAQADSDGVEIQKQVEEVETEEVTKNPKKNRAQKDLNLL